MKTHQVKQVVHHHHPNPETGMGVFSAIVFVISVMLISGFASGRRRSGVFRKMRPQWKSRNKDGYVLAANGRLEHREIAEKILRRRLTGWEDVHHMNGVRHDNRLENMCVMDHRDHMRYHEWYDWVRGKGKFPRRETQLRKLREDFKGVLLADVVNMKIG